MQKIRAKTLDELTPAQQQIALQKYKKEIKKVYALDVMPGLDTVDNNLGNALYDPATQTVWLIDFETGEITTPKEAMQDSRIKLSIFDRKAF